ncbi:MAG: class I SAM-dependent methyltransferase [Candidatus Parvarchaeota archaeon]
MSYYKKENEKEKETLYSKIVRIYKKEGLSSTIRAVTRFTVRRVCRNYMVPTLHEISSTVTASFNDVNGLISELLALNDEKISELWKEYSQILEIINDRQNKTHLSYPKDTAVSEDSGFLIFSIVRIRRPEIFLETGVANGMSSSLILYGMHLNGNGKLISFEVSDDVGSLIPPYLRDRWVLRILKKPFRSNFLKELNSLSVDMFLHDSDHSFKWQSFEYNSVEDHLREGGMMLSDDIDSSYAFLNFIKNKKIRSYSLIGVRKVFGIVEF